MKRISKKIILIENAVLEIDKVKDAIEQGGVDDLTVFEMADSAMVMVEENMIICQINKKAADMTGFMPDEIVGKNKWTDFVVSDNIDLLIEFHRNRPKEYTQVPSSYEFAINDKFGNRIELLVNVRMITQCKRNLISLIDISDFKNDENAFSANGITEWKRQEEELQESRHRFKEIADLLPGIICEFDLSFKLTYINQKGLQTFGVAPEEFNNGISIFEFILPHLQAQFEKDIYNIFHGDFGNPGVYKTHKRDKSIITILVNSAPILKHGIPIGMRTCIIDISDRVLAEEKLRLSEEMFRTVFAESPIGIAIFNSSGVTVEQNRSFKQMFSFSDNKNTVDFKLFSLLCLDSASMKSLSEGGMIVHETSHKYNEENVEKKRFFEWHITSIGIEGSENSMFLTQVKDITEQKEALDAQLRKEQEAAERAQALIAGLRKELREKSSFHNMVSRSAHMKQIFEIIPEVAQATATVLVSGDSGTGKELVARSLHELSFRKTKPFVAINCSALPDNLLESELFGYKAGAFTDAKKDKPGKFALAEGGTIFLDEIGDISTAMQVKMLRVLQERVYEPLGGTSPVKANVRVIAATNKDLKVMVSDGLFREDLYYRINVVTINLPNLNDRRCDIPILCEHFIDRFNVRYDKMIKEISKEAMDLILSYKFPGNIRELENVIEHAFIFCKESVIEPRHLPMNLRALEDDSNSRDLSSINNFDELEKMYIKSILLECSGDKTKTALRLGVHRATLFRKLKQHGLN
jgi:PAS domain S-box-containing protein